MIKEGKEMNNNDFIGALINEQAYDKKSTVAYNYDNHFNLKKSIEDMIIVSSDKPVTTNIEKQEGVEK